MADDLPREIGRGVMQIGPLEIDVVNLDDGRRVVTQEGMAAFMTWLETGEVTVPLRNITPEDSDG